MDLPLSIGKRSNNDIFQVDLKELNHLFISYSDSRHLQDYLGSVIQLFLSVKGSEPIQFYLSLNRLNYHFLKSILPEATIRGMLVKFEPELSTIKGKGAFMKSLMKIFLSRKKKTANPFLPLVVIVDDVFDLIITKKKYTGEYFLDILKEGHHYGIYFIFATIRTYHNLMAQFQQKQNICAELIINPEYFFYFKTKDELNYTCYYPVKEYVVTNLQL